MLFIYLNVISFGKISLEFLWYFGVKVGFLFVCFRCLRYSGKLVLFPLLTTVVLNCGTFVAINPSFLAWLKSHGAVSVLCTH